MFNFSMSERQSAPLPGRCICVCSLVGTLETENFRFAVLTGTDPQESTAFDLRL